MQGGGELPWEVTCRGVVDGIAMVIHMTRHEGRRFVGRSSFRQRLRSKGKPLAHPACLATAGGDFPALEGIVRGAPRSPRPRRGAISPASIR